MGGVKTLLFGASGMVGQGVLRWQKSVLECSDITQV